MEKNNVEVNDRILSRVTAADLTEVVGGMAGNTCQITGPAQENINGSDITNLDWDCD